VTPRTRDAYERWAATYDSDPNPQTALEFEPVLQALRLSPGARLLDAACGTGRYFPQLLPRVASLVGFDFAPAMLRRAQAKFPTVPLVQADLQTGLPFGPSRFSHVLCAQTLKHCPELSVPVPEFFRVLRPGGTLVFSVTHPDMDFTDYEMRETPAFILSQEADIIHHSRSQYLATLVAAGFQDPSLIDVPVTEAIAPFLTPASFARVRGRPQVAIFRAFKPLIGYPGPAYPGLPTNSLLAPGQE